MANLSKSIQVMSNGGLQVEPTSKSFKRLDIGIRVPDDGNRYVMVRHEWELFGTTRHAGSNRTDPRPAVANAQWGIETLAKKNGDYYPIEDRWQRWFCSFWDWASGYLLPHGEWVGRHKEKNNPDLVFDDYTPGSLLSLYAGMIRDAKSHTDSHSPETGARDVVTGRNINAKNPWAWLCRPTTGALLKVIGENGTKLKIEAINLNAPEPNIENIQLHQFYFGTQVSVNGTVTRYPDVKNAFAVHGIDPAGTAMPLVAPSGYFLIDKKACMPLSPNQLWLPYYTP